MKNTHLQYIKKVNLVNKKIIEFQVHKSIENSALFLNNLKYRAKTSLSKGLDKILDIK